MDVGGLEEERPEPASEEEEDTAKKWMKSVMKELKERKDDVSDFERSMTTVQLEMKEVKVNMKKVAEAFSKITDDNHTRDRKFDEPITKINEELHERDLKTDEQIERRPGIEDKRHGKKALRTQRTVTAKVRRTKDSRSRTSASIGRRRESVIFFLISHQISF